jgi:hypothetical protein
MCCEGSDDIGDSFKAFVTNQGIWLRKFEDSGDLEEFTTPPRVNGGAQPTHGSGTLWSVDVPDNFECLASLKLFLS